MLSQQTYMTPPLEDRPHMPVPPAAPPQVVQEYNEQLIESLAQRLMPRLMPEILYNVRNEEPARSRNSAIRMSMVLAIVSIVLLVPLTAIVLGFVTTLGGGITAALIGIITIGVVMVLINVLYNNMLFNVKR